MGSQNQVLLQINANKYLIFYFTSQQEFEWREVRFSC